MHGPAAARDSGGRAEAVVAGYRADEASARDLLSTGGAAVRAAALAALARMGRHGGHDVEAALSDPSPAVRRRLGELAGEHCLGLDEKALLRLLSDDDADVVEAGCFAAGELGAKSLVKELAAIATAHGDVLCRESAVAALGAIGDVGGLDAILSAMSDKPTVRRRAVIALSPFSGSAVEAALRDALSDRDWQVRQAAEELTGAHDTGLS